MHQETYDLLRIKETAAVMLAKQLVELRGEDFEPYKDFFTHPLLAADIVEWVQENEEKKKEDPEWNEKSCI